jgi:hypothetical protein
MLGAGKDHIIGLRMRVSSLMETRLGIIPMEAQDECANAGGYRGLEDSRSMKLNQNRVQTVLMASLPLYLPRIL